MFYLIQEEDRHRLPFTMASSRKQMQTGQYCAICGRVRQVENLTLAVLSLP